jgi:hypothetical protein
MMVKRDEVVKLERRCGLGDLNGVDGGYAAAVACTEESSSGDDGVDDSEHGTGLGSKQLVPTVIKARAW